jgi:hypothetical protein
MQGPPQVRASSQTSIMQVTCVELGRVVCVELGRELICCSPAFGKKRSHGDMCAENASEHRTADDARIKARTHTHTHICTHTRMYSIRNPTVYLTRGLIYMYLYMYITLPPFNSHVSDILLALITGGIVSFMIRAS